MCSENNGTSKNLSCTNFEMHYPEKTISAIQKWSNEHSQKTYLSEFSKQYPDARLDENGMPKNLCPSMLGLKDLEDCGERSCIKCWN